MSMHELPTCSHCHATQARHQARFCRTCGAPLDPTQSQPLGPDSAEEDSRTPRPRWRRRLLVTGAVVVILVLTVAGLRALQDDMSDPTDPVEDLLSQIADGRGAALLEHTDGEAPLLHDQALAEGYAPPENLRTTDVTYGQEDTDTQRPNNDAATVHIEYEIRELTHTAHVRVQREDTGWVRSWELVGLGTLLGELVVTSDHLDRVRVAGAEVETTAPELEHHDTALPALPGTYTLATTEETLFLTEEPLGEVTVPGPDAGPTTVADIGPADLTVRDGLVDDVAGQVVEHLQGCAEAETLTPPGCPLRVERTLFRSTADVAWNIALMPEIAVLPSDEASLHGAPLEVETSTPGSAEVEWTYAYTDDEEPQTETIEIIVAGTVTVDEHGEPVWTP